MAETDRPIIIKKKKKGGHHDAHHGGAWKVAYADFVTAMMAFFLLLWLLNVTTDEQRAGIADYFDPASVARTNSGSGGVLGGTTITSPGAQTSPSARASIHQMRPGRPEPVEDSDAMDESASEDATPDAVADIERGGTGGADSDEGAGGFSLEGPEVGGPSEAERLAREAAQAEQARFEQAEAELRQAVEAEPALEGLARSLMVDMTPEGLQIQIVDQDRASMFPSGSALPLEHTRRLLGLVARVVSRLPNDVTIAGHTDSIPFPAETRYGNWELSADRANASRRVLIEAGLSPDRIARVEGQADTDPLFADDPASPRNRRISITLLREQPPPAALARETATN